ncbi:MAG: undecaprenyl-diphosphatase UppP [Kofleriaceae bacterium]
MSLWLAALLGLVQGLTEFIPVSSSAHLRIVPALLHEPDAGAAFTAIIQLGSLAAVVAYFWHDLVDVGFAMFRAPGTPEGRMPWLLAIGTVPLAVVGLMLKKHIEGDLRSLYITASMFILFGIAIWVIDHLSSQRTSYRPLAEISLQDVILIGLAQSLALVPGVSRSGGTICMALLLGFTRTDSARFSFLLSIPAIAGSGAYEAYKTISEFGPGPLPALAVGTGVAAVSSYAAIAWLMRFLTSHHFTGFAIYRIVLGIALFGALAVGWLVPL